MLWFKLFFVLLLSEAYGQQQNKFFRKDYNFIDTTDSFYKIHTVTKSWRDAKRICGLEGASFFYPEDQTEADAVLQFLSATQKSMRWVYIGVSDVLAREVFEATDGKKIGTPIGDIYNNWAPGWPTGKHPQNCVSIHSSDGLLREDNCVDKLQFVCKKKLQDVQWNEHCNMPNIDYKYNSTLGKCYKFHLNPLNWTDAYYACSAERSYLAVINSQAEADHLAHMTEHAPKDNIGGDYLRGVVHLGFHNRDNEGWATIKDGQQDYKYVASTESFYKIHTVTKNWSDAKRVCSSEGASFFYPEDQTEADAVLQLLNATQSSPRRLYIGISARDVYEAVDGMSIEYIYNNWESGQPKARNPQHCVSMSSSDGVLHEDNCVVKLQFVCKKRLQDVQYNVECKMPNMDYEYNATLGKCYKFHLDPMNWNDAFAACNAEQSYLAIINSQAEANHLVNITAAAPKDNVGGSYLRGAVHLGFQKIDDTWKTIKGTPLVDSGYSVWAYGQPDNASGNEVCGSMFYSARLNDINCDQTMFFICEHDIEST